MAGDPLAGTVSNSAAERNRVIKLFKIISFFLLPLRLIMFATSPKLNPVFISTIGFVVVVIVVVVVDDDGDVLDLPTACSKPFNGFMWNWVDHLSWGGQWWFSLPRCIASYGAYG